MPGGASDIIGRIRAMAAGRVPEQTLLSLDDVIRDALQFLRHEVQSRGVAVSHLPASGPQKVVADRTQLQQVIVNLAVNAVQAIEEAGSTSRNIVIRTVAQDPAFVRCSVEDSGPGIEPQHVTRLFDSFFTTKGGGMGMGLRICQSVIEAHGGRIAADNGSPHGGARFFFTLPVADTPGVTPWPLDPSSYQGVSQKSLVRLVSSTASIIFFAFGSWLTHCHSPRPARHEPRRLAMSANFVDTDPAQRSRSFRRSRCRQPPPAHWPQRAKHVPSQSSKQGDPQMATTKADANPPLLFPCSGRGARRLAQAHQRHEVARPGTGDGRLAGRAARHDAEAGALLGDRARLAQGARRGSTPCRNFITEIDGLDIHFIHVRSKHENALPMIVTHGWPGSIIEQIKIIEPLTNPTAHGGSAADAFHLVIPSLPGYGFSGKPTAPGWNPVSIAKAWATLMQRLGYTKYVAQGGDWGNAVSEVMALQQPPGLLGIHTNMAATVPPDVSKALAVGGPPPAGLSPDEKHAWDQLDDFYKNGLGYALEMNNRPQTLYGIADSPVGLAAWMIDHDIRSYQMIARAFDGKPEGLTRDDVLDNVTLYWLTNTAISSARLYWDTRA